jgi:preprotein translocase SecE subunit
MAVAVKNSPETITHHPLRRLAMESLMGVVYILGSLGVVFYGLPHLWRELVTPALADVNLAVQTSFLVLLGVLAFAGLVYLGVRLVGPQPTPGLAAGIFLALVGLIGIAWFTLVAGWLLERWFADQAFLGMVLTLALGGLLGVAALVWFFRPGFEQRLVHIEEQGWFSIGAYKRTQGQRVRRGTLLGIVILVGCGIYSLLQHNLLPIDAWQVGIPFSGGQTLTLLPHVRFTVPLLLALAGFWAAYRVVNFPVFADFLIATEAELNKVSWTTRKRLVQDTIVVLVTVVLLTVFLFVVDQIWALVLTKVGVLQIAPPTGGAGTRELPW